MIGPRLDLKRFALDDLSQKIAAMAHCRRREDIAFIVVCLTGEVQSLISSGLISAAEAEPSLTAIAEAQAFASR